MSGISSASDQVERGWPQWYRPQTVVLFVATRDGQRTDQYRDSIEGRVLRRWWNGEVRRAHPESVAKLLHTGYGATLNELHTWAAAKCLPLEQD